MRDRSRPSGGVFSASAQLFLGTVEQFADVAVGGEVVRGGGGGVVATAVREGVGVVGDFAFGFCFQRPDRVLCTSGGGLLRVGQLPFAARPRCRRE